MKKLRLESTKLINDLCLDSGAHSFYMGSIRRKATVIDGADRHKAILHGHRTAKQLVKTKEFKDYMEEYVAFLHKHGNVFSFYVNLDIISHAALSWEMQTYMESCGLSPVPVFHSFEDRKWFFKYLDNHDFIGVSGLGHKVGLRAWIETNKFIFDSIPREGKRPLVKIHGFAVNSSTLLMKFPWYSADSSTINITSRMRSVMFPVARIVKGGDTEWDYLGSYFPIRFGPKSHHDKRHFRNWSEGYRTVISDYLNMHGIYDIDSVGERYDVKDALNLTYNIKKEEQLRKLYKEKYDGFDGPRLYISGNPVTDAANRRNVVKVLTEVADMAGAKTPLRLMGTFFYPRVLDVLKRLS